MDNLTKLLLMLICLSLPCALLANENEIEKKFIKAGLIDVNTIDSSIRVDLVNSDKEKNFFEENFYSGLKKAYLRKEIAVKLSKAQSILMKEHPNYSLQVLDAARPRSVSRAMLKAGFYPLGHEWWHFNGMKKTNARNTYSIIE